MTPLGYLIVATAGSAVLAGGSARAAAPESTPLKLIQNFDVTFPPRLLAEGVTSGQVRAVLHVGPDGRLLDSLILAYSHEPLADELAACLREWTFAPARSRGEPVATRSEIHFEFSATGAVLSLTAVEAVTALNRWIPNPLVTLLCPASQLDRPLAARETVTPVHPGARFRNVPAAGEAVIDFYVDSAGQPRMPAIARATHDYFGAAALDALAQWRFLPPTRLGQPVCVRVRQLFQFNAPLPAPPGGTD